MDQYFEWCDNNVLYPHRRQLLEPYLGIPSCHPTEFDKRHYARVFVDQEMQKIFKLLQVAVMERNYILGTQHIKTGANTTMNFQPMNLSKIFKCAKSKTRSSSTQGTDCPLGKVTMSVLEKLQGQDRLMLEKWISQIEFILHLRFMESITLLIQ